MKLHQIQRWSRCFSIFDFSSVRYSRFQSEVCKMPSIPNHIDAEIIMFENQLKEDLFQKADHRTVPSRNTGLYRAPPSAVRRSAGANEKGLTGTLAALVQVCIWLSLGLLGTPRYPQTLKIGDFSDMTSKLCIPSPPIGQNSWTLRFHSKILWYLVRSRHNFFNTL